MTYGYGHMDNSYDGFISQPWINKTTGLKASSDEMTNGFINTLSQPFGQNIPASNFENVSNLTLPQNHIEKMLEQDVMSRHKELWNGLPNYQNMDANMQIGALETHFNSNILNWPNLRNAAINKDKDAFIQELHRKDYNNPNMQTRNQWVYDQCSNGNFIK